MREDIGYVTFKSGSKLGVLGKNGQPDKIYSDQQARESDIDNSEEFTKNTIFLTYLKDQMDIADEVKGQVIFSTQLRKLVEQGLMRDGIPIDYIGKDEEWDELTDTQRAKESKIYSVVLEYEKNIDTLTDLVKADILKMTGFKQIETQDGISYEPVKKGDYSKLLSFAKSEIERQDFAPNEETVINSVLNNSNSSDVKDLSYNLSSAQIAKVINSLITKRMINQKVNGESLVQASTSLFEKMKKEGRNFTKPTDEELSKYGTLDLPFYEYNENGTKAMKVKIAMQGQFLNLLKIDGIQVTKPDGTIDEMASLRNLNSKLKDEKWLDEGNNRQMITMNGVRIPVQGLNSMDFMEVYEFLPPGSPNIIIAPSEVVAKSGADFDIDKMTVIMPNILVLNGKALKYTSANIKKAKDQIDKLKKESKALANKRAADFQRIKKDFIKPADQKRYAKIVGPTEKVIASYEEDLKTLLSDNQELIQTKNLTEEESAELEGVESQIQFIEDEIEQAKQKKYSLIENEFGDAWNKALEKHKEDFNAKQSENKAKIREIGKALSKAEIKMAQNNILTSVVDMLKIPESFGLLTKPNTTADLLSIKHDLSLIKDGVTKEQLAELNKNPEKKKQKIKELDAKFSPTRIFEPLFNLEKHQSNKVGKQILGIIAIDNTFDAIFNRVGFRLNNSGQRSIRFVHNTRKSREEGSKTRETSLSGLYDVDNNFRISDIISQLINGSVDVAKDDWISKIQGNKEAISTLLLLNQAGVPIEEAIYFLSIDSLQDYYKELQLTKSKYAKVLETDPPQGEGIKKISKIRALRNLVRRMKSDFSDDYTYEIETINNFIDLTQHTGDFRRNLTKLIKSQLFTGKWNTNTIFTNNPERHTKVNTVDLFNTLSSAAAGKPELKNEFKALLHYFELETPTDSITTLKNTLNVDTTKSGSAYEAYAKKEAIQKLLNEDLKYAQYDPEYIEKIMSETAIKGFFIQDLQIALMKGLFPTITSDALLDKLNSILNGSDDFNEINRRVKILFGDKESYAKSYVEDFGNYLLQRLIKDFDKAAFKKGSYKGYEVEALPTQELDFTLAPVQIKDGVIYYSESSLVEAFEKYESTTENNKNEAGELNPPSIVIETIDEYLHFNLERAALKEAIPFKSWLKKNEKNPSIEYKKFAAIAQGNLQEAYQLAMNSQALFNINNNDNIFRTISEENSISINYVERFLLMKQKYPKLAEKINLVNDLESESTKNSDSNGMSVDILTLGGIKLTSVNVANYHTDLQNLSDPDFLRTLELSEDKYINENDIDFISNLFSKFTEISIMQSGMKGSSSYALTRIVDHEKLLRLVGPLAKAFNNPINKVFQEALVDDFTDQFETVNTDKYLRTRNKNYKSEGENSRVSNIYEALENPNQTFTPSTFADGIFSTPQIVWDNAAYKTLQKDFSSNTAPRLLAINGPTNVSILNTSVTKENNISDLAGIIGDKASFEGTMKYSYGNEKRSDVKADTTFDAILSGERTATTRYSNANAWDYWKDVKAGDTITWKSADGRTVDVIVTKDIHPLKGSGKTIKDWSKLEGWSIDHFNKKVKHKLDKAWQIEFKLAPTQPDTGVNVISEDYGVVQVETNPTKDKKEQFLDIIRPQIQAQTYKENVGKGANQMFHFGKMWSRVNAKSKPIKIKSFAPVVNRDKLIDAGQNAKGNTLGINEYTYAYHELDQNGNPLPSMSALQPIIDEISQSLGIDMSDYDSVIGNIYQPGEFIYPHKDVTESKSAEKYPVIVYTIGANASLGIVDNNKGKMTFANQYDDRFLRGAEKLSGYTNEVLTKDGTIYTFGMGGKGRFQLTHSTPINDAKKGNQPPITLPNGKTITNYTITLTFRRAADLTKGVSEEPKRFEPTSSTQPTQPSVNVEYIKSPKNIFSVKPIEGRPDKKATIKSSIATQYIGFAEGIAASSTASYASDAGFFANTGNYGSEDVIFVSIGGKRGGVKVRKEQQDKTIKEAIKAVEAGATIITDNVNYIHYNSKTKEQRPITLSVKEFEKENGLYNLGEKRLYENMKAKGYNYSEVTIDGQTLGTWSKSTQPTQQSSEVKEGVGFVFEQTPELSKIGSKEEYSSWINYMLTKGEFKATTVKDIVYRGFDPLVSNPTYQYFTKSKGEATLFAKANVPKSGQITERNPTISISNNFYKELEEKYDKNLVKTLTADPSDFEQNINDGSYITPEWFVKNAESKLLPADKSAFEKIKELQRMYEIVKIESENDLTKPADDIDYINTIDDYKKLLAELKPLYFKSSDVGKVQVALLNITNPYLEEITQEDLMVNSEAYKKDHDGAFLNYGDHFLVEKTTNQIYELGSKKDIQGFKEFVSKLTPQVSEVKEGVAEVQTYKGLVDIKNLKDNEDTVFGSNQDGYHGGGTAGILYADDSRAYKKQEVKGKGLRVEVGKARGFQTGTKGSSYALQTVTDWKLSMNDPKRQVPKDEIIAQIKEMYDYYNNNPDRKAYVLYTTEGKNLNGYTHKEMADMFLSAGSIPSNVIMNKELLALGQPQADVSYGKSVDVANNAIFLFDKATDGESGNLGSRMLSKINSPRVVGLPTLLSYTDSLTNIPTDVFKAGGLVANQTLVDEVDKITDAVLDKMNKEGYSLVLPKTGIAQELVRAYPRDMQDKIDLTQLGEDMPTLKPGFKALVEEGNTEQLKIYGINTFIEISKILYDKFGYINPNFVKFQEGKDYLLSRSGQVPISNDVTNSLRDSCK